MEKYEDAPGVKQGDGWSWKRSWGGRPELASELGRGAGWERLLGLVFSLDGFFDALPGVFGSLGCGSGYSLGFL